MTQEPRADATTRSESARVQASRYECGALKFEDDDYYDRHLVFDHPKSPTYRDPSCRPQPIRHGIDGRHVKDTCFTRSVKEVATPTAI